MTVERIVNTDGSTVIRKELRRPSGAKDSWAASIDPRHWNYWHRELDVYQDHELRHQLAAAGLELPNAEIEETPTGAVIHLEDIHGVPGPEFTLDDHAELARAVGRWQAVPAPDRPWTSIGFLRDYSTTRDVRWDLLDDDAAWQQPLIVETWPPHLRAAWRRLVDHREDLLTLTEKLPRARCHLDLWVSNVIRRPAGGMAALDWAFTGDGALGEDIGNHIPDAVFDLFWPAERMPDLAETCVESYLDGLHEAGWTGDDTQVRLAVMASGVKYAWLLPLLLARASDEQHQAYHREADGPYLFRQRGIALAFVAEWCAEALSRGRR
ncbi:aminoglycoside phosphotransferase family protein [Kribbella amoyensis]|uniref:aminoglycoside phosphotransferase family protein n=1 Tax=Kribbella amoyensis TaxID=996641 RepID=UPI001EE28C13|nr:aminoglycoside phosphotransferase family protein [Kribbella amoyensis]